MQKVTGFFRLRLELMAYRLVLWFTHGPITRLLGRWPGRVSEAWMRLAYWLASKIYCRTWGHHFVEIDENEWTLVCALCDKAAFGNLRRCSND